MSQIMVNLSVNFWVIFLDTVKIGVIRVKVQFGEKISKDGLIKNFFYMGRVRKLVVGEM